MNKVDVHRALAASMFGVPYDQVTPEQRAAAKRRAFYSLFQPPANYRSVLVKEVKGEVVDRKINPR